MQNAFGPGVNEFMDMTAPLSLIEEQTRRNIQLFQETMRMFAPAASTKPEDPSQHEQPDTPPAKTGGDLDELRDQLAAMQRKIDALSK